MRSYCRSFVLVSLAVGIVLGSGCTTTEIGSKDQNLGAAPRLLRPQDPTHRAYLGLVGTQPEFSLDEIEAEILILEVFDMYCHYCQSSAEGCNAMVGFIARKAPTGKVKMLGIGSGNTPFEIDTYRREYGVQFPLVADRAMSVASWLENSRIPALIALRKVNGRFQPYLKRIGVVSEGAAESFLDKALAPSDG